MKAIVNTAAGKLQWQELQLPEPPAGWVRIRTVACGICATDLEMIAGWERTGVPAIPGHEWCGRIDAVGAHTDAAPLGALCVASNVLADGGEVGFEHAGGYAQFFLTEAANLHHLPEDFHPAVATLIEPLAVVMRGLHRLAPAAGVQTVVIGDGPIGLLTVAAMEQQGLGPLTLVGGRDNRLELAARLGASATVNYHRLPEPLAASLPAYLGNRFAQVIEASGSPTAMAAAMDLASPEGRLLVLGDYGSARASFPWNDLLHRELTLIGSNASAGAWPAAVRFAIANPALLASLVTHRLPAADYAAGMALMQQRDPNVVKAVLEWE